MQLMTTCAPWLDVEQSDIYLIIKMRVFVKIEYSDNHCSFVSARGTLVFRVDAADLEVLKEILDVTFVLGRDHSDDFFEPLSYPVNPANHDIVDMAAEHAKRFAKIYDYKMRVEVKAIEDIEARRKELMDELKSLDEGHEWI